MTNVAPLSLFLKRFRKSPGDRDGGNPTFYYMAGRTSFCIVSAVENFGLFFFFLHIFECFPLNKSCVCGGGGVCGVCVWYGVCVVECGWYV